MTNTAQIERVARVIYGARIGSIPNVRVDFNAINDSAKQRFRNQAKAAIAAATEQESTASLDERMKAAGMIPLSDLVNRDVSLDKWMTHADVKDYDSFEWFLKSQYEQYTRMQISYDLDKKPKDDMYEWVLGHAGAFGTMLSNWVAVKKRVTAATEWQPIEIAPIASNLTRKIWILGGQYKVPELAHSDGGFWAYELRNGSKTVPTHWCPQIIPAPPALVEAQEEE